MEGERDPASQFQFSSPVQGFLGLCISSLRSSVDKSRFALKMGMGTVSCSKSCRTEEYPADNNSQSEKRLVFAP